MSITVRLEDDEEDFFNSQSTASQIKARIVSKYFDFWCSVMHGRNVRLGYLDLYCGPGVYSDGNPSTPILILKRALERPEVREKLVTCFNDIDPNHTDALKKNIDAIPGIEKLKYKPIITSLAVDDAFADELRRQQIGGGAFSFVDPFGYKGISIKLLRALMGEWGSDLVLFFSYNRINSAINYDGFRPHMDALFGASRVDRLREITAGEKPHRREALVLEEFAAALGEHGFRYVLPFTFKRPDMDRTSHHIILITRAELGYGVMKEIMAKESSEMQQGVPTFVYAKPLSENETPLLFELDRPLDNLEGMLLKTFAGQSLTVEQIYYDHHVGRRYLKRNYQAVLKKLYREGRITTDRKPKGDSFAVSIEVTFPG